MILIIDHFDSFVETLARYVREAGRQTRIIRQDTPNLALTPTPDAVILSPGPGTPANTGASAGLLAALPPKTPILGVCLGHQLLAHAFGGEIGRAPTPRHGKASAIYHQGHALFDGLANPFEAGLYHALTVCTMPPSFAPIAHNAAGDIMGIAHETRPLFGVQFHPESILTPQGRRVIDNFLGLIQ